MLLGAALLPALAAVEFTLHSTQHGTVRRTVRYSIELCVHTAYYSTAQTNVHHQHIQCLRLLQLAMSPPTHMTYLNLRSCPLNAVG